MLTRILDGGAGNLFVVIKRHVTKPVISETALVNPNSSGRVPGSLGDAASVVETGRRIVIVP